MLDLARVVAIHPESHAVDLFFMADGRRIAGVQVLSHSAGGNFGMSDLSTPDINAANQYESSNSGTRDIYAVVGWSSHIPLVLGFMFPQVAQCLFPDKDRMVYRHSSDVYFTVDKDANTEVYHPSGTFMRIGTSAAHEDLTGKDFDKVWKISRNTSKAVHVNLTVKNAGSEVAKITIDPSGNVVETNSGNLSATAGGTSLVKSTGNMTLEAPQITMNAPNVIINGALSQGMGGNSGACTMLGPLTVTNDVIAQGTHLHTHVHSGVTAGGSNTGQPV